MSLNNLATIKSKINESNKVLIIASKPVDKDSLGTALSIQWYLNKKNKNSKIVLFAQIPEDLKNFPDLDKIDQTYPNKVNYNEYDSIVLIDGNSWKQFFTNKWEEYLYSIDKEKLISIDHHLEGEIEKYIPKYFLRIEDCCTAKVFFDYFVKNEYELDIKIAEYMFLALIGDTGNFKHAIKKDTFAFAQILVDVGIEVNKLLHSPIARTTIDFTTWMFNNTEFIDSIQSMIFVIDSNKREEANKIFGSNWEYNNLDAFYKLHFGGNILGYPYFIKFSEEEQNDSKNLKKIRISWRRSNWEAKINLMEVFKECGFVVGGHLNAGGGLAEGNIQEVKLKFIETMSKYTNNLEKVK